MGLILWAGLRHLQALRESVAWGLAGQAIRDELPRNLRDVGTDRAYMWLRDQGLADAIPQPLQNATTDPLAPEFAIMNVMDRFRHLRLPSACLPYAHPPNPRSLPDDLDDVGVERSGAGWQMSANFIITSAFVRMLGAYERFELDVLKAVFYYRPAGRLGHALDRVTEEVTREVVLEEPKTADDKNDKKNEVYEKPSIWTWMKRQAEHNETRKDIFKKVFQIERLKELNDQWKELYDKRNAIAHGRSQVLMPLKEFMDAEVLVERAMIYIAEQCLEKLKLEV